MKGISFDDLGEPYPISWKTLRAKPRFLWKSRNSAPRLQHQLLIWQRLAASLPYKFSDLSAPPLLCKPTPWNQFLSIILYICINNIPLYYMLHVPLHPTGSVSLEKPDWYTVLTNFSLPIATRGRWKEQRGQVGEWYSGGRRGHIHGPHVPAFEGEHWDARWPELPVVVKQQRFIGWRTNRLHLLLTRLPAMPSDPDFSAIPMLCPSF